MNERMLTKRITDTLKKEFGTDAWVFKVVGDPRQRAGVPDILVCARGYFVALEVKMPGKEHNTSKLQDHVIQLIDQACGVVRVISSPQEAVDIVYEAVNRG